MEQKQNSGFGVAGMVIGIVSVLLSCIVVGGITGIVGLILSLIAMARKGKKYGMAIAGITLNIIAIIIMIMMLSASGNDDETVKNVTPTNEPTQEIVVESQEQTKSEETVFHIGEVAEYKGVQVSVSGYEESIGNDWAKPADGKVFVFPEIEICNNSNDEISISSMLSFECYCDDYKTDFSSNAFMALSTDENKAQLDGSVASGKKMKGVLGVEVPSDWSVIEIYYKDNAFLGSNFKFVIEK